AVGEVAGECLERLPGLDARANDVAVAHHQLVPAVALPVLHQGSYALLKDTHLFHGLKVVEDDPLVASNDNDFANLVGIGPAHMDLAQHVVGIPEDDEPDVLATVAQRSRADRADPKRGGAHEVVEDGDVVRGEVPERIDISPDWPEVGATCVQVVDPTQLSPVDVLFDALHARVVEERMPYHEGRSEERRVGKECRSRGCPYQANMIHVTVHLGDE